ncbi:MAG: hypothetical protein AB1938_05635 [Myxococcota bacterium]
MARRSRLALATLPCLALALATSARADTYDFKIYQLGNPQVGGTGYTPRADANFRAFVRQFGAAMTSVNLAPPETLGHSGFAFNAELSVVDFQGGTLPTEGEFKGPLLIPSLHVRKGLPYSFEIGARAAWIEKSRMGAGTFELKWAVNEGFTYLPDIGVRGSITKLVNTRDFDVTCGGLDIGIGKQFAIAGMITITPYVGWNLMFVGATTSSIDFRPSRTLEESDTPGEQYRDFYIFESVLAAQNTHNRFYGGFRFIGGVAIVGAEISYSVLGRFRDAKTGMDIDVPAVLAGNFTVGLDF